MKTEYSISKEALKSIIVNANAIVNQKVTYDEDILKMASEVIKQNKMCALTIKRLTENIIPPNPINPLSTID